MPFARIDIHKEAHHFSCAHFTVFGPDNRENLHGHDFAVRASVTGPVDANGLCFDYNILKNALSEICQRLDESVLLPANSPHLNIELGEEEVTVGIGDERLRFLPRDVTLLPVRNVTVEELGHWLVDELNQLQPLDRLPIDELVMSVSAGPSQTAIVSWKPS